MKKNQNIVCARCRRPILQDDLERVNEGRFTYCTECKPDGYTASDALAETMRLPS